MRILVAAPLLPQTQPTNAVPLVTHALLTALAPRHQVTLVTATEYDDPQSAAVDEWRRRGVTVHCVPRVTPRGAARWQRRARLAALWLGRRWPWRTVWYWEPRFQTLLNHVLGNQAFDIVAVEDNAAGVYAFSERPSRILTEMEVRTPNGATATGGSVLAHWLHRQEQQRWQAYQQAIWRRFDRIQVLTPRYAEVVAALAPDLAARVRVNPFGIELPARVEQGRLEENEIVFVGGFTHPPNVEAARWLVLDILPRVSECCPNIHVTLVGSYPPPEVRTLAGAKVTVTGTVPAVEPYIERAAVIVAPVRSGGGQRIKVLQGMAHAKAVVTTALGAQGLEVEGEGLPLVIAEQSDQFAAAITRLLTNVYARAELGARAREFVARHFSPEAYARRLERIYAELCSH